MICKMNKLTMLVYHKDYEKFLNKLRDAGVVHITEKKNGRADSQELLSQLSTYDRCEKIVKKLELIDPKNKEVSPNCNEVELILEKCEDLFKNQEKLLQEKQSIQKDVATMSVWGNFDNTLIEKLVNAGYVINFFQTSLKNFDPQWITLYNAFIVKQISSKVYFITITAENESVEIEAEIARLPLRSLNELNADLERIKVDNISCNDRLKSFAEEYLPMLRAYMNELQQQINFSKVKLDGEKVSGDKLLLLEGWVPEQDKVNLKNMLNCEPVFYELSKPTPEDNVPIKFNNNVFFRMFEPICELYMLPKYNELDLTPFFAPFYMIFFGLCLGDMGYGLVMSVVALILILLKKVTPSTKGYVNLVLTLGVSTILCGSLTGTFFGFNIYEWNIPLVDWWRDHFSFAAMNPKTGKLNDPNPSLFNLSLILGGIQIFYAMIIKVVNITIQTGFKYALSTLGWIIILLTVVLSVLFPAIPMNVTYVCYAIGAICVFLLNSPGKNPLLNIGLGIWDTYNMLTGLLGDILSYVRLFALGLSGGILAMVFNSLATGMSPDNSIWGPVVTVLIFLIGHFINMFMNILGSLVHPMRLTFVEFFKNSGYEGGGKAYNPFKNNK